MHGHGVDLLTNAVQVTHPVHSNGNRWPEPVTGDNDLGHIYPRTGDIY